MNLGGGNLFSFSKRILMFLQFCNSESFAVKPYSFFVDAETKETRAGCPQSKVDLRKCARDPLSSVAFSRSEPKHPFKPNRNHVSARVL